MQEKFRMLGNCSSAMRVENFIHRRNWARAAMNGAALFSPAEINCVRLYMVLR
jgi:hypothetical protein